MIPKIIHYCWFGGKPIPYSARRIIRKCKKINPEFKIIIWNEKNFDLNENEYVQEAYCAHKYAFVTDYVRLKVLYEFGGVYMDTDVNVLKSLEPLLTHKGFTGFEDNTHCITATMGAEKGNRWIKLLLDDYNNRHFINEDGELDLSTNTIRITNLMQSKYQVKLDGSYQDFNDFTLYPFDYFCANNYNSKKIITTANTYTVHLYNASWLPINSRIYIKRKRIQNKIIALFEKRFK